VNIIIVLIRINLKPTAQVTDNTRKRKLINLLGKRNTYAPALPKG